MSDPTPSPSTRPQAFSPPAAPQPDQSVRAGLPTSAAAIQSQLPASPPLSTSASQFDAAAVPSPQVFTPVSAPMSAEHSMQGFGATESDEPAMDVAEDFRSRKHRLEDEDVAQSNSKRRRTDHEREEAPLQIGATVKFGPLYKLCETAHPISQPHMEQNLISLYSLDEMAASVARKDPKTGEKINKLRKSYEGKVKELPGKNKAISKPGELMHLLEYPDEEWHIQQVSGKELGRDLSESFLAKLDKAVQMQPGKLPDSENDRWRNVLGNEDAALKTSVQVAPKNEGTTSVDELISPRTAEPGEALRPKRRGTKRRYHDDSFEGYGEAFDEEGGDNMSLDGDDDGRGDSSTKRKRRKDALGPSHFSAGGGMNSYAHAPVSVGSGSYSGR